MSGDERGWCEIRDEELWDAVRSVPAPEMDDVFIPALLERLEEEDSRRATRRWRGLARRPWQIAFGAAVAAAAVALILTLTGVPGVQRSSPQPATAAQRLVADIDAGLARVQTLQGVYVVDDRAPRGSGATNPQLKRATFAVTAAGDRYFDIRYRCNRAAAVRAWHRQLKALGRSWRAAAGSAGQTASPSVLENDETTLLQLRSVTPRAIWACDATTRDVRQQVKREYVDALTGKTLGWSYHRYAGLSFFAEPQDDSAAQVWLLGTQLRIELAQNDPGVTVTDAEYQNRPVQKATITNDDGTPAYVAFIDDRYGVTLALERVPGAPADRALTPFHVEHLRVNQSIPASRFTMSPDYGFDPSTPLRPASSPLVASRYVTDFGGRVHPAADLGRLATAATLVPSWVPAGYHLEQVFGAPGQGLSLVYRRGLLQLSVDSAGLEWLKHPPPAFKRPNWAVLMWDEVTAVRRGPLAGWPVSVTRSGWLDGRAALSSYSLTVTGDLTPRGLLRVTESVHAASGAYPAPSEYATLATVVLSAGIAITLVVALLWFLPLRRQGPGRPSIRGVGWLPMIGAAVVVLGASLDWHTMLGYGHSGAFAMTGWQEPLALATVGVALAAAAMAACMPLVGRRPPVRPRFVAVPLACLAVAAAIFGVFYLPMQARFVIQGAPELGDFLDRHFANPASPSAGAGLYVSILGCLVLLVGVFLIRGGGQEEDSGL